MAVEFGRRGVRRDADAPGRRTPVAAPPSPEPIAAALPTAATTAIAGLLAALIVGATALLDTRAALPTLVVTFVILVAVLRRDVQALAALDAGGLRSFILLRLVALAAALGVMALGLGAQVGPQGMTVAVLAIAYMVVGRAFGQLGEMAQAVNTVRTAPRRSRWFIVGMIAGAAFFVANDRAGWVPLSISDALGLTTDKVLPAIEQSGVLPQLNSTFSYTKDGFATQAPKSPGPVGVSETEWTRMKAWFTLTEGVSWYFDLIAFAAAAGLIAHTIMVRFLGFAETGDIKSDD